MAAEEKGEKNVKHFRTIHILRSLPDQGEDVCKFLVEIGSEM